MRMASLPLPQANVIGQKAVNINHAVELERQRHRRSLLHATLSQQLNGAGACLLEAGCGHGHWLVAYAQQHPDTVCVGLDLMRERIDKALIKAARAELQGVHFIKAELLECLDCLPVGLKLHSIVFLFPDPWPKKRHHRRRMIQMDTLTALAERATHDACLYFRSDDASYVDWTREILQAHPSWELDETLPWLFEQETLFQQRMGTYQSLQARRVALKKQT
jgi:tRNA (guanine-N7-)-methyltransferase